jgi:hypothetical protein
LRAEGGHYSGAVGRRPLACSRDAGHDVPGCGVEGQLEFGPHALPVVPLRPANGPRMTCKRLLSKSSVAQTALDTSS